MNADRALAYSVMESIEYMTGHAPKRSRVLSRFASWTVIAALVGLVLFASATN